MVPPGLRTAGIVSMPCTCTFLANCRHALRTTARTLVLAAAAASLMSRWSGEGEGRRRNGGGAEMGVAWGGGISGLSVSFRIGKKQCNRIQTIPCRKEKKQHLSFKFSWSRAKDSKKKSFKTVACFLSRVLGRLCSLTTQHSKVRGCCSVGAGMLYGRVQQIMRCRGSAYGA